MHAKLLILLALAGCLYAASDAADETTVEPTSSTTSMTPSTTTSATSSTTNSTSSSTTDSTSSSTTTSRPRRPPPKSPGHFRPMRPIGRPRSPKPVGHSIPPVLLPGILPIRHLADHGLKIADHIARGLTGSRGPRQRPPRALASFSVADPLQMMKFSGSLNLPKLPDMSNITIPNMDEIMQAIPQLLNNSSELVIPKISPLNIATPPIPGMEDALNEAHEMIASSIGSEGEMPDVIQTAMEDAFDSENPVGAMQDLFSTVINAYRTIVRKCPLIIVKKYLLVEALHFVRGMINILQNL